MLTRLGEGRGGLVIALLGLVLSLAFSLVLYPKIAGASDASLDPDFYGPLGFGLWKYGTLSYFPDTQPSIFRGPLYPAAIAGALALTGGLWPQGVQVMQSLCFGLTCFTVFRIARSIWNARVAALSSLFVAVNPVLIWYTSRIWVDTVLTLLVTMVAAALVSFCRRPALAGALLTGTALGLATLAKGMFLPFVAIVPLLLLSMRIGRPRLCASMVLCSVAWVAPWTFRNFALTGAFVPVHVGLGSPMSEGDTRAELFSQSPFGAGPIFQAHNEKIERLVHARPGLEGIKVRWQFESALDSRLIGHSLRQYRDDPLFLAKKTLLNAANFWLYAQTPAKTLTVSVLQLPLLLLAVRYLLAHWRVLSPVEIVMLAAGGLFFLLHLPVEGQVRYAAPLVPVLAMWAAAALSPGSTSAAAVSASEITGVRPAGFPGCAGADGEK